MKAWGVTDYTSGLLRVLEVDTPPCPGRAEVQLALLGTSINPVDRLIAGGYGAPLFNPARHFPFIPGRDAVARIVRVGSGVKGLSAGQRALVACSPLSGGTWARTFNLPARCVTAIDDRLPEETAAGIGYAGLTALQALSAAGISPASAPGTRVCINGASGGVGSIVLLIAARSGARVTAIASRRHHDWLHALGATETVDYRDSDALQEIRSDVVINAATPSPDNADDTDPMLSALHDGNGRRRTYATTITPVLSRITRHGLVLGVAGSGIVNARKRLAMHRAGIRYRWVMFREEPEQLAFLAAFFSQAGVPTVVREVAGVDSLASRFNHRDAESPGGKSAFLVSRSDKPLHSG